MKAKFLKFIFYTIIICTITVILLEFILVKISPYVNLGPCYNQKYAYKWRQSQPWPTHDILGYTSARNYSWTFETAEWTATVINNEWGFRGKGFNENKSKKQIMWIGDSFIQAAQVDEEYTSIKQLEGFFKKNGHSYFINNFGVGSWSTVQYFNTIRIFSEIIKPDIIIVTLFHNDVSQDVGRNSKKNVERNSDGLVTKLNPEPVSMGNSNPLYQYYTTCIPIQAYNSLTAESFWHPDGPEFYGLFNDDKVFKTTELYLEGIKNLALQNSATLILSALPMQNQVGENQYIGTYHTTGSVIKKFEERTTWPDMVKTFSEKNNIYYLDLLRGFRKHNDKNLYFKIDGHLNKTGNRVMAELAYDFIKENNIIK